MCIIKLSSNHMNSKILVQFRITHQARCKESPHLRWPRDSVTTFIFLISHCEFYLFDFHSFFILLMFYYPRMQYDLLHLCTFASATDNYIWIDRKEQDIKRRAHILLQDGFKAQQILPDSFFVFRSRVGHLERDKRTNGIFYENYDVIWKKWKISWIYEEENIIIFVFFLHYVAMRWHGSGCLYYFFPFFHSTWKTFMEHDSEKTSQWRCHIKGWRMRLVERKDFRIVQVWKRTN